MYLNKLKLPIFLCWTFFSTYYANEFTNDGKARTQKQQISDTYRIESLRDLQQDQGNLCSSEEIELKDSVLIEWKSDETMTDEQYAILQNRFRDSYDDVNLCSDSRTIENVAISSEGFIQVTGICINCPENTGLFQYTTPSYRRRSMTAVQEPAVTTHRTIENLAHTVPEEFAMERLRGRIHNNNNRELYDFETQTHTNPNNFRILQRNIDIDETCSDGPLSVFNSDVIVDIDLGEGIDIESVTDADKKALAESFKNTYNRISSVLCGEVDRVVTDVMVDNVILLPSGSFNNSPPSARFTMKTRGTCQQCLNREGLFQDASNVFTGAPRRQISFRRALDDQGNSSDNVCEDEPVYGTEASLDIDLIGDRNLVTSDELGALSRAFLDAYNELASNCGQGFRILYDSEFDSTFSDSLGKRRVQVHENFRARIKFQGACRGCRKNPNIISDKQNRRLKNTPEDEQFLRYLETNPKSECLDEPQNDFESIVRLDLIGNENDASPAELKAIANSFERTYNDFVQIWCGDDIRRITEVTLEEEISVAEARMNSLKRPRRFLVRVRGFCRSCTDSFKLFRTASGARRLNSHTDAHSIPTEQHFEQQSDLHSSPNYHRQGVNSHDAASATQPLVIPPQSSDIDSDVVANRQFSKEEEEEDTCDVNSLSPFYSTVDVEYLGYPNNLSAQEITTLGEGFLEAYNKISDVACPQGFRSVEEVFTDINEITETHFSVYAVESDTSNNSSSTAGNFSNSLPNKVKPKIFFLRHRVRGTCRQCPSTRRLFNDASNTRKLVAVDDVSNSKTHGRVRGAKPSRRLQGEDLKNDKGLKIDKGFTVKRRIGGAGGERNSKPTPKNFSKLRKSTGCDCEGPSRIAFAQVYNNTIQKLQDEGRLQNILIVTDSSSIYENVTSLPPTDECGCSGPTTIVFAEVLNGTIQELREKGILENISAVVEADDSVLEVSAEVQTCECESPDATELANVFNRSIEALIENGTLSNIAGVTGIIDEQDPPRLSLQCGCDSLTTSQFMAAYNETIEELVNSGTVQSITGVSENTSISENVTAVPNGEQDSCICDAPLYETFITAFTANIQTLIDEEKLPPIVFENDKLLSPTSLPKDLATSQPTLIPTQFPSLLPTLIPTIAPTLFPTTDTPSQMPTETPSLRIVGRTAPSTDSPTISPTALPTLPPTSTSLPAMPPTSSPSPLPTSPPTASPTFLPTQPPTSSPTTPLTQNPTLTLTSTPKPPTTTSPTITPTGLLTALPTQLPTILTTQPPTLPPTLTLTPSPTQSPTSSPTSLSPTTKPTLRIVGRTAPSTDSPTTLPTALPTLPPTVPPSLPPTSTSLPTMSPTSSPTQPPTSSTTAPITQRPTQNPTLPPTLTPTVSTTQPPTLPPAFPPTSSPTQPPPTTTLPPTTKPTLRIVGRSAPSTDSPSISPTALPTLPPTVPPSLPPTPTALPTTSPTSSPTPLPTSPPTESPTFLPTQTPTLPPTLRPTVLPTALLTQPPTASTTLPPTSLPTQSPTSPTTKPTLRIVGRSAPSTDSPTISPTALPTLPPTVPPSLPPTSTSLPTMSPTSSPTQPPTSSPTTPVAKPPTPPPTQNPTLPPTLTPTLLPTVPPTHLPTASTTQPPTSPPTTLPPTTKPTLRIVGRSAPSTDSPSISPTALPTLPPTVRPPSTPPRPSLPPTSTSLPTTSPTSSPTPLPTSPPTAAPTFLPTQTPTLPPTLTPSPPPTASPTVLPTSPPTASPTQTPTSQPTSLPTLAPTLPQTMLPPTTTPTRSPTKIPTNQPINTPTNASDDNSKQVRPLIQPRAAGGGGNVKLRPNSESNDNNNNNNNNNNNHNNDRKNGGDDAHPNFGSMIAKVSSRSKDEEATSRSKNPRMAITENRLTKKSKKQTKKAKKSTKASSSSCSKDNDDKRRTTTKRPTPRKSGIMVELPNLVGGFFNRDGRRL